MTGISILKLEDRLSHVVNTWPKAFMRPQFWEQETWSWETNDGSTVYLERGTVPAAFLEGSTEYLGKIIMGRLFAPGCQDSTEATPIKNHADLDEFIRMWREE